MLGYHPNIRNIGQWSYYCQGWQAINDDHLSGLVMCAMTSPIIFKDGKRAKTNFECAQWLTLDFDGGVSLESIVEEFRGYRHLIGTTKSHQVAKGGAEPSDRFRLWVFLSREISDARTYEATCRHYVARYSADPACVDAARIYMPCKNLVRVHNGERRIDPVAPKIYPVREKEELRPRHFAGVIPPWVGEWLRGNLDPGGGRNRHIFKTALWLTKNGMRENEIVSLVMGSALVEVEYGKEPMTQSEIMRAIHSGIKAAQREK